MQNGRAPIRWLFRMTIGVLVFFGVQGCSSFGPRALNKGRPAYNEAIASTNAEQLLAWIVKMRYGMTSSLLTVASITANIRFSAEGKLEVGIGSSENFAGNLVPLSGGVSYDESPTIQYLPVQGEKHLRQLLAPIPLDLLVLLVRHPHPPRHRHRQ